MRGPGPSLGFKFVHAVEADDGIADDDDDDGGMDNGTQMGIGSIIEVPGHGEGVVIWMNCCGYGNHPEITHSDGTKSHLGCVGGEVRGGVGPSHVRE